MELEKRLRKVVLVVLLVILGGLAGYMVIEGWPFLDALYMTVITLSTVGFREVRTLSPAGMVFTMALIAVGVGGVLYTFSALAEYLIAGQLRGALERRQMNARIAKLENHYILCGFGRVGQQVALEWAREGLPFVVIDNDPESLQRCASCGYLYLEGDAANDELLKAAGIHRARGLVTAVDSDADNVYVTLSARGLCPDLWIVARANLEGAEPKLLRAGANRVLSPYSIGGRRMASLVRRPAVVDFLDVVMHSDQLEMWLEEITVQEASPLAGNTIGTSNVRQVTGATILAVRRSNGSMIVNPSAVTQLQPGDTLIAIGTTSQLKALAQMVRVIRP